MTFYGVRGSTPSASDAIRRHGGNTACVVVREEARRPILLDLGTGLRYYGYDIADDAAFDGVALVSHLHWDHVQGLPFFVPVNRDGARLEIYGPAQSDRSFAAALRGVIGPPYFPVELDALAGELVFHDVWDDTFDVDGWRVRSLPVPHVGPTVGYRIECGGASIAYISDHQQPGCGATEVASAVLTLARDVDVLIHDAQYIDDEFAEKPDWGHSTVEYAVRVAAAAGAERLVLFHHDPLHTDDMIDDLVVDAAKAGAKCGLGEVLAAYEGLTLHV